MEIKYNEEGNSLKSGIYKIFNKVSGRIYIGSAKNFKQRFYQHKNSLLKNKHQNKFLQNDFNKCLKELGHDDFLVFEVMEVVIGTTRQRRLAEQKYVKQYFDKQDSCYNIKIKTIKKDRTYWSSTPEETKEKLSIVTKKTWDQDLERKEELSQRTKLLWQDESYRQRMKLIRTGQKRSEETKDKLREQKLGCKNPMYKKIVSNETKEKMSKNRKGRKLKPHTVEAKMKMREARLKFLALKKQYKELKKSDEFSY